MDTIDKKLKEVLVNEEEKLSKPEIDFLKIIKEIEVMTGQLGSGYTIPLKDTIGKNVYFNTLR